jgi:hypothetical protein
MRAIADSDCRRIPMARPSPTAKARGPKLRGNAMRDGPTLPEVSTSDGELRIAEFLARHGGPGERHEREGDMQLHTRGWSEVYAGDGYRLRCEWSKAGSRIDMSFVEIPPETSLQGPA